MAFNFGQSWLEKIRASLVNWILQKKTKEKTLNYKHVNIISQFVDYFLFYFFIYHVFILPSLKVEFLIFFFCQKGTCSC